MASLNDIDHFVVLMLENRSFDNLFGALKDPKGKLNGLTGDETNPDGAGGTVNVWNTPVGVNDSHLPNPDPGELFTDINFQIGIGSPQPMQGFAANYAAHGGNAKDVMHYFVPEQLPALSALAKSYAVCDEWYASAPCQTWPNRFFVHTGTANGYVNNSPTHFPYEMPTIFNAIHDSAPHGWKIYFHDVPHALTLSKLWTHLDHFKLFEEFLDDAELGVLPSYSFIEPRYFADEDWPNDMHPPHNIVYGDQLVEKIYTALKNSPNWNKTLLVIMFDEHGGCYDHVLPPAAVSPETPRPKQAFAFDRYGVRTPAVIVSPLIQPGTILRAASGTQPYDHTSIISTLRQRFNVQSSLTQRDKQAPTLEAVLNLAAPSDADRLPVSALAAPASDDLAALNRARLQPLNDMQKCLCEAVAHLTPLMHAVKVEAHVSNLLSGFRPHIPTVLHVKDAVPFIKKVLGKLLP